MWCVVYLLASSGLKFLSPFVIDKKLGHSVLCKHMSSNVLWVQADSADVCRTDA